MDFPYTPTLDKGAQTSALTLTIYRLWPTHTLSGVRGKPWISPTPTIDKGAQTLCPNLNHTVSIGLAYSLRETTD